MLFQFPIEKITLNFEYNYSYMHLDIRHNFLYNHLNSLYYNVQSNYHSRKKYIHTDSP